MNRRGVLPSDDFGPLLPGPAFGGLARVTKVLFTLGCFQQEETCPKCNHTCKLKTDTRMKKLKDGSEREYTEMSFRCTRRKCQTRIHFVDRTIWANIKDRILFIFVVNAFLNRSSTQSIVNNTGCKAKTAEKYLKIIKKSLFLENEFEKREMLLGGDGETVQIDESCVFSRKYGVGGVLETSRHGWVFGIIEDKPDGLLFIQMVRTKDAATLKQIIKDHVREKTTIFTDCWPSYNGLEKEKGFKHYSVNHSEHFVEVQQQQMDP